MKNLSKKLFYLSLLLISSSAFSLSAQLGFGGLTPHFADQKKNYCNQWNDTGIIVNKTYYLRLVGDEYGLTYMRGNDSICSPIEGMFIHYYFKRVEFWDVGVTVGGYSFNIKEWEEHAEKTPSGIDSPEPVQVVIEGRHIVPVLALEVDLHLIRRDRWSLKLNNLFTPVIFNHSISYEYRF